MPYPVPYGDQAASINQFMTNQAMLPFMANLPNYANMVGQRSENTMDMLKGEIPDDVISQIAQGAAERGIMGGSPGSPNANAAYLRALGLNSLDLMGKGSDELSKGIADTPVPEIWNPASLWVPSALGQQEMNTAQLARTREGNLLEAQRRNQVASAAWNNRSNTSSGPWSTWSGGGIFG